MRHTTHNHIAERDERSEIIPGLVSVVICAYNNWPDVEMTIESALHQSYQPLEVIVIDNSSADATPEEIPKRFGHHVRYLRQLNRECAGAYNAGFELACGEFIQFVDGDDVLAPNKVEKQVEIFRAKPELDIVYGDTRKFQTLGKAANWIDAATQPEDDMLKRLIAPEGKLTGLHVLGMLFHRRALEKVGPWDESLYNEDYDYWLRAAYAGCRFAHCPRSPLGFYRIRSGQKTENVSAFASGMEVVWNKALGYITREPYRSLLVARLAQHRFYMAVSSERISKREALSKLALARRASPHTISVLACAIGCATLLLPGGTALIRSQWLRPIRRFLAGLLHYRMHKTSGGNDRSGTAEGAG